MSPFDFLANSLEIPKPIAIALGTVLAVAAGGAVLTSWFQDADLGLNAVMLVGAFVIFVLALSALPHLGRVLASWLVFLGFTIWIGAAMAQGLTGGRFTPPLASFACLLTPWNESCQQSFAAASIKGRSVRVVRNTGGGAEAIEPSDPLPAPVPDTVIARPATEANSENSGMGGMSGMSGMGGGATGALAHSADRRLVRGPLVAPNALIVARDPFANAGGERIVATARPASPPDNPIYLHYFAPVTADQAGDLAVALSKLGWNMTGGRSGIDKEFGAQGLAELRYFAPKDRQAAQRLARDLGKAAGLDSVETKDLSGTKWAERAQPGAVEIWIGEKIN